MRGRAYPDSRKYMKQYGDSALETKRVRTGSAIGKSNQNLSNLTVNLPKGTLKLGKTTQIGLQRTSDLIKLEINNRGREELES